MVRVEDLDPPREVPGATQSILDSLIHHGLLWDGDVVYQSQRRGFYDQALATLKSKELLFPCRCSRKSLADHTTYPGFCREKQFPEPCPHAVRIRCCSQELTFHDGVYGPCMTRLDKSCGDFVLLRRDNWVAYQLAVVVDDHLQGITEVVRGIDLIDATPRQLYLFQCLNWQHPKFAHLPLATNSAGEKLGKSTRAPPLDPSTASQNLVAALEFLSQITTPDLASYSPAKVLDWAIKHWDISRLAHAENRIV